MNQLVILGWDALDAEVINKYGLAESFGGHVAEIETYVNPVIDHPHTKEVWPSMITGVRPDVHGIHAVTEDSGVEWGNPLVNLASNVANGIVPQPVLDAIGRRLRERGAQLDQKRKRYYREHGIETVFDGVTAHAISIPNHETDFDRTHDLDALRDDVWNQLLVDRDGVEGFEPDITTPGVYDVLGGELGKRIGHTVAALPHNELVWTWFGCLDTVGHMAPAMDAPVERDWYHTVAGVTESVRQLTPDETTVVAVSDHGLQDGEHTNTAAIASANAEVVDRIDSVFDVAPYIQSQTLNHGVPVEQPGFDGMDAVKEQLQGLGYVDD